MLFITLNHQWICIRWKHCNDVYGALTFVSQIYSGRTIFLKGWLCIWMPAFQVIESWSSALISRLIEDWNGRLCIKENLDMNTVMILPEVHLALQIKSFLCFLPHLTSSVLLLCPSYSDVLFFQITVSFIFHSLITSWKMILQHNFLENKSTLLKHSFSCTAVFYIITIQLWVILLIWKITHHNHKSPKISLITIRHSLEHCLSPLCELTCKWIHIKPWILKAIYRHNLHKDLEMPNKLQSYLSWPDETQCNAWVNAATNQVSLPLGHLPDCAVCSQSTGPGMC